MRHDLRRDIPGIDRALGMAQAEPAGPVVLTRDDVAALLPMTEAMKGLSARTAQLALRSVVPVGGDNRMGVMPGAISDPACFGASWTACFPATQPAG